MPASDEAETGAIRRIAFLPFTAVATRCQERSWNVHDIHRVRVAEIRFGIEQVNDAPRRAELKDWLAHKVRPMCEQRVLPVTEDIMLKWRLLVEEEGRRARHTFSQPDLIIAATALWHGLTVVSRDTGDYARARVPVLDPWSASGMRGA